MRFTLELEQAAQERRETAGRAHIEEANRQLFLRECQDAGLDPQRWISVEVSKLSGG